MTIEERQLERTAFLLALYELADANRLAQLNFRDVAKQVGITDEARGQQVADWLSEHELLEWTGLGGFIAITTAGIDEAERLQAEGASLPPLAIVLSTEEQRDLEAFLGQLRRADDEGEIPLAPEERAEMQAEIETLEAQLRSPRPKRSIVREGLRSLRTILENVAAGGLLLGLQRVSTHFLG